MGKNKKEVEMPGIEPGAFHMQSERSTAELHPPVRFMIAYQIGNCCRPITGMDILILECIDRFYIILLILLIHICLRRLVQTCNCVLTV